MQPPWPAPVASSPIKATVAVPGSKSVTNRALVLAALAQTPTTLHKALCSRDTALMATGLRALGASITRDGDDLSVQPAPLTGPAEIDVGNAGTVMRFLPPVAALATGDVHFVGDRRAADRPLRPMLDGLAQLGASITSDSGRLPLTVHGRGWLLGGVVRIDASLSSQFVSALLLAAPRFADGVEVQHEGGRLPSGLHIAMTVEMLRAAGAIVEHADMFAWRVEPGPLDIGELTVEPDLSNAAAVPRRGRRHGGSGHGARLAGAHESGRRCAAPPARTVRRALRAGAGRAHGHRTREDLGHRRRPRRCRRAHPGHRGGVRPRERAVEAARHRPPAPSRDRPAGRAHQGDQRASAAR